MARNLTLLPAFFLVLSSLPSSFALPVQTAEGASLTLINQADVHKAQISGQNVSVINESADPYQPEEWRFRFPAANLIGTASLTLEIEFLDQGAGVIAPQILTSDAFNGAWKPATRQASYTRLNTGKVRKASFAFSLRDVNWETTSHPHLKIVGLQYLIDIQVRPPLTESEWQSATASIPTQVTPMFSLKRPMQIACSAGISVQGDRTTLETSLASLSEYSPLAKVLGFTSIETYVRWDLMETVPGEFDFSYYDALTDKIQSYGLKWFPLLIIGSAYSLPDWFLPTEENIGFVCLEHGKSNLIQTIWNPHLKKHVSRVLSAFGQHYEAKGVLEGVRLGPSGNYGESQYPAGGNWGLKDVKMHIHIGYWCGDKYAREDLRSEMKELYPTLEELNKAWSTEYSSWEEVQPFLPEQAPSMRARFDFSRWYTDEMTEWCDWWVDESRRALPNTKIYQSAGGWGFLEGGTDFVGQTKSMVDVQGGIRMTNETDSLEQDIYVTRLAATAARLYGVDFGSEPASSHTARGTVGRLFNLISNDGDHFFTYQGNIFNQPVSIRKWLQHAPMLDQSGLPVVDVAVYYPETMNRLDDGAFGHLYGWGFYPRAREIRTRIETDYLDESLIREGFLDRYKVLVFCWGNFTESDVLDEIDRWVRSGGTIIYPSFPRGPVSNLEGESDVFNRWESGDVGKGSFHRYKGDMEPTTLYGDFVERILKQSERLGPGNRSALAIKHPESVLFSVLEGNRILAINFGDRPAEVRLHGVFDATLEPYTMRFFPLN